MSITILNAARNCLAQNIWPVPVEKGTKKSVTGWPKLRISIDELSGYFDNGNQLGMLDGVLPRPISDTDIDCEEALAVVQYLKGPKTDRTCGRASKRFSHYFHELPEEFNTKQFKDPVRVKEKQADQMIIELRGRGGLTVIPPSTHKSGEAIRWEREGEFGKATLEELLKWVGKIASAALLVRYWQRGHETRHALAGMLARCGWQEAETAEFVQAVIRVAQPNNTEVRADVGNCYDRLERKEELFGRTKLEELLGDHGKLITRTVIKWLALKKEALGKVETVNDADDAELLVNTEGENLLYCFEMKKWLVFDGRRWKTDEGQRSRALMEKTMRTRIAKVTEVGTAKDIAAVSNCLDSYRITNGLREAEKKLGVLAAELDAQPFLITFNNGTLNLETMELEEHDREHRITKMVHYDYKPEAKCPRFLSFLEHAIGEDAMLYLQKLLGYSLTGDTSEKTFVIVWGVGDTGKTTFLEVIRKLLEEYAVLLQVDTLMERRGSDSAAQEDLASLRGMRFATTSELDQGRKLSIAVLKRIVQGQGKITACAKWEKKITFDETHKLWFDTNHFPMIPPDEQAVWNRVAVVVFSNPVPKNTQDKQLAAKLLRDEAEGILAWMIEGEQLRQKDGGIGYPPKDFVAEKTKWQKKMDVIQQFVDECCVRDEKLKEKSVDLYKTYVDWNGVPEHAISHKVFTQRLSKIGIVLDGGRRNYGGVSLVKDPDAVADTPAQTSFLGSEKP